MANRKRNIRVWSRLTQEEYTLLQTKIIQSSIKSQESYIRKMALTGYIIHLDTKELRDLLRLVSNATNNINQIARRANETKSIFANDVGELLEQCETLKKEVKTATKIHMEARNLIT